MTSSEKILAGIAEESKTQADKINSDAEKQAADIIAAAREEAVEQRVENRSFLIFR